MEVPLYCYHFFNFFFAVIVRIFQFINKQSIFRTKKSVDNNKDVYSDIRRVPLYCVVRF